MTIARHARHALFAVLALSGCTSSTIKDKHPLEFPIIQREGDKLVRVPGDHVCTSESGFPIINPPGTVRARECVLLNLTAAQDRADRKSRQDAWQDVSMYVDQLVGFYNMRSRRQQLFSDTMSAGSFLTALGAGLSGGAGAVTQQIWLGAAFTPVVISNVNSNEPTRDLYYAGAVGLAKARARYSGILASLSRIADLHPETVNCSAIADKAQKVASWATDDRDAVLPEIMRLFRDCLALDLARTTNDNASPSITQLRRAFAVALANDARNLDARLTKKDYDFRSSPAETLRAIAASPFRALDTLLSGQDTSAALDKLATNAAFNGLDMPVGPAYLPPRAPLPGAIVPVSDGALARMAAKPRAAAPPVAASPAAPRRAAAPPAATPPAVTPLAVSDTDVIQLINGLTQSATDLSRARLVEAERSRLLDEAYALAAASNLTFAYDTATGAVTVDLKPPAPPATPAPQAPPAKP